MSLSGLQGADTIWAIYEMTRRGFQDKDAFSTGGTQYSVFYNPVTRQCVQLTMADGRVYDAREIGSHPKCR